MQTQQDDKNPVSSPKPKSPPRIASESPTVLRPVPVKPEDGPPDQNSKQKSTVNQPTTDKVVGQMSRGPSMQPGFHRSVSMQGGLGYLSGNSIMSSQMVAVPELLQKLLSNAADGQRVMQQSLDRPPSNRQIHTVESLERRHDNQMTLKKSPETDSSQGSGGQGQGSNSKMMTVESLEQQHTGSAKETDNKTQAYPIQNLLAQLSIAQRTGQHETTEGSVSSMSSSQGHSSFAGKQQLPSGGGDHGHYGGAKAEDIVGQPNPDINQKLLTNLTSSRMVVQTSQPSSLQFIQPSSIQPNLLMKPKGSGEPEQFTGTQGVRSLQQIVLGGMQFGQMRPNLSATSSTNGVTTHTVSPLI